MTDIAGLKTLHRIAVRENRGLMQYILGAFPWTTAKHSVEAAQLLDMVEAERDALAALTRYLYRYKMPPPHSGGYPTDFTSLNFADLGYIAGVLATSQEQAIAQFKADLATVHDEEGKALAQSLLDLKVRDLNSLRKLTQPEPAVMS